MTPRQRHPKFGPKRRRHHFIKQWREHRELTQDQLAERLFVSKATISRIEGGTQSYTQDFLEACAEALRTEPASLIMRDPTNEDAIWSLWDRAEQGQRQEIERFAEFLVRPKTGT